MVQVQFLGMPKVHAGCDSLCIEAETLGDAIDALAELVPGFVERCCDGRTLRTGFLAAIDCRNFTTDPSFPLTPGQTVQILSADAGG